MEKKEILKKLLLGPLDWITLTPFLAGVTLGLGAWAIDLGPGLTLAASAILILISGGIYLQRLMFGWDANSERIVKEWQDTVGKKREQELDNLYRALKADGDPRTEALLKDLRTLTRALMSEQQSESPGISAFDIVSDVDRLFQRSVAYLKESLQLWHMAQEMERENIKADLLQHRELLIVEVEKSLENLGKVLGSMKKAVVNAQDGGQLAELREELTNRLKLAEEVDERMKALRGDSNITTREEEMYLKYAE